MVDAAFRRTLRISGLALVAHLLGAPFAASASEPRRVFPRRNSVCYNVSHGSGNPDQIDRKPKEQTWLNN